MRKQARILLGVSILAAALPGIAAAAETDPKTAREHELLHRVQQQLQQIQAENADLQRGKSDAEARLKAASAQLDTLHGSEKAEAARSSALDAELRKDKASGSELATKLDETTRQLAAMTQKQNETASELGKRESELAQVNASLSKSNSDNLSCEAKNQKLFDYGQVLLQRYQKKGVWDALTNKEPVLGLERVDEENTVQEYRNKLAAEKLHQP